MLFPQSELGRLECRAAKFTPKGQCLVWATVAWPDRCFERNFFAGGYPPAKNSGKTCKQPTKCKASVYHVLNQECIRCPDCTGLAVDCYRLSVIGAGPEDREQRTQVSLPSRSCLSRRSPEDGEGWGSENSSQRSERKDGNTGIGFQSHLPVRASDTHRFYGGSQKRRYSERRHRCYK